MESSSVPPKASIAPVSPRRPEVVPAAETQPALTLAIVVAVIAGLYFGREIFVPIALSILLSFALAPPVRWLRRIHIPRIAAVLLVVTLAFMLIAGFASVVAWQVTDLARGLPTYQRNIEAKIDGFRNGPPGASVFTRATQMVEAIGNRIDQQERKAESAPVAAAPGAPAEAPAAPIPVEVHEPDPTAIEQLEAVLAPLIGPLATAGIVIVLVIFMLLKREDLRDRVIRLFGSRDLSRTTQALNDAGKRVGHYLLMQLTVNATYGLPIAIGLWVIGVPNPLLWGMLATVLRFVPYIGPVIGAFFPLALALAVEPGWTTFLWAAGLIVVVELISSNAVEPWLYGASTGMSPVAIIAAAIFWTWLWGPIGLLLSTPLTVCLVVLGQHVPQLAFLDVLLGSEAVLTPPETLYQRMIGGDPVDATERAEEYLRDHTLTQYYQNVGLPALAMAESDRARRALDEDRRIRLTKSFDILMDNLAEHEDVDPDAAKDPDDEDADAEAGAERPLVLPEAGPGAVVPAHRLVICAGARGNLDDVAAAIVAQLLERHGARCQTLSSDSMQSAPLREVAIEDAAMVVVSYMNPDSLAHARFLVRRLRRRFPGARIVAGFWTLTPQEAERRDPQAASGADIAFVSLDEAIAAMIDELADGDPAGDELGRRRTGERRPSRRSGRRHGQGAGAGGRRRAVAAGHSAATLSSSVISPSMTESPICQNAGSPASSPNGASSSRCGLVPPALSSSKYLSWKPLSAFS